MITLTINTGTSNEKECKKCGIKQSHSEYSKKSSNRDGLMTKCKTCQRAREKERRDRLKDRSRETIEADKHRIHKNGCKECPKCNKEKPVGEFNSDANRNDGLQGYCKSCQLQLSNDSRRSRVQRDDEELLANIREAYGDPFVATKECDDCHNKKSLSEFPIDRNKRDGICIYCIPCHRRRISSYEAKKTQFRTEIKRGLACSNCGFTGDPRCLEFAHIDREDKYRTRNGTVRHPSSLSIARLIEEIPKTRPLCRNCHAVETYNENHENLSDHPGTVKRRNDDAQRREIVNQEKLRRGQCIDCELKVTDTIFSVFDFDHLPGHEKIAAIGTMVKQNPDIGIIIAEMTKCELRCRNCHAIKTSERGQYTNYTNRRSALDVINDIINGVTVNDENGDDMRDILESEDGDEIITLSYIPTSHLEKIE